MHHNPKDSSSGIFFSLMFLAMVSWGGSWVTARWASAYDPALTAFWRFFVSALSYLPFLWFRRESLKLSRKSWPWVLGSALSLGLYNLLFLTAMQHGPGGFGGVLVPTMNPIFAFMLSLIFLSHRFSWTMVLALALGLGGGILQVLGPGFEMDAFTRPQNLLLLGAALLYASLTLLSSRAQRDMSVFQYSFWTSLLCSAFLLPLSWGRAPWDPGKWGPDFWINVAYLGLVAGTFGTTLYFSAAKHLGGARASGFAFLVPVSALVLSFLFLGEEPQWTSVIGGGLSVAAVLVLRRA